MYQSEPTDNNSDGNRAGQIISDLAAGLFALFLVFVIFDIFPSRLLDPIWMVTFATSLCNSSSIALAGLALVHLAGAFNPDSQLIKSRQNFCSRLAAWAALGFLMLLPLLGYANWKGVRNIESTNRLNIAAVNQKANELKAQINQASTQRDLQERMAKFQGPALPDESLALPLAQLKKQSLELIQSSAKAFEVKTPGPFSEEYKPIYKQSLRAAVLSLVAALSFAAGAWNPRTNATVLNSIASFFNSSLYRPNSAPEGFSGRLNQIREALNARAEQAAARQGMKKMKDSQRKIFLQREKEDRRSEAEMRKQRARLKRQAEQKAKRKDSGL